MSYQGRGRPRIRGRGISRHTTSSEDTLSDLSRLSISEQGSGESRNESRGQPQGRYEERGRGYDQRGSGNRFDSRGDCGSIERRGMNDGGRPFESRGGRVVGGLERGSVARGSHYTEYPESETLPIILANQELPGTNGRRIELLGNFFPIIISDMVIYQHDIDMRFQNEQDKSRFSDNEKLQKFFATNAPKIFTAFVLLNQKTFDTRFVYDSGKSVYTTNILDTSQLIKNVEVDLGGRQSKFLVTLKMVRKIDSSTITDYYKQKTNFVPDVIRHFFELFYQYMCSSKYYSYQHKMFDNRYLTPSSQKPWINFVQGFVSAIRLTEIGPTMNLHLKTSCLLSPEIETLVQLVCHVSDGHDPSSFSEAQVHNVNKFIRGLKVFTMHTGRKTIYTIKSLHKKPTEETFSMKVNGSGQEVQVTVADYFKSKYQIELKDYPCVHVMGKKNHLIPLELCELMDRQFLNNSKIDSSVQNELLRVATNKPVILLNKLTEFAKIISSADDLLKQTFGTDLKPKPIKFYGRVLDPPVMIGAGRNEKFFFSPEKPKWGFFSFDRNFREREMENFLLNLKQSSLRFGLDLSNCQVEKYFDIDPANLIDSIINIFRNLNRNLPQCKFLLIVLPYLNSSLFYNMVKHVGDQKFGVITQCLHPNKARNPNRGYIENVLLKVNGKLGGKNSVVEESELKKLPFDYKKTMVIGLDVSHPSETERVESSVAVAIGSYDHTFTLYNASICVQKKHGEEIIDRLEEMIEELLNEYFKVNKYFPENLFVFRDGVSEGQFQYAESEIKAIRLALRRHVKNGKIVFLVTQKNHQTRFVLAKPEGPPDRLIYNVPSGTIVDTYITEPYLYMFYLNSHFSPLGTSRPMKYVCLQNDFERRVMSNDNLQKFCFYLCHNCTRFRGPLALPTPIRYADLCAYRSKLHLDCQIKHTRFKIENRENLEKSIIEQLNSMVKINENIKHCLYYA